MIRISLMIIATITIIGGGYQLISSAQSDDTPVVAEIDEKTGPEIRVESYTIQEDDTFTSAMEELGISYSEALEMVKTAEVVFDFTSIKLGKSFKLIFEDEVRTRLEYEPNSEMMIVVDLTSSEYKTIEIDIPYDIRQKTAEVTITNSMYASGLEAGLDELLILKLADVFAWEVDFATQVQAGDTYKVIYEQRSRNGVETGVGNVLAAKFVNVDKVYQGFRYLNAENEISYFNENGESLVREFLKAPLSYSRITSGFTYARFHPTLKTTSPHLAIDYAAPSGTPIMAVADGRVTFAAWSGGFGRFIDIRHNSIYETQYAHLSGFNVRAGDHVKQGDIIGYVGSTGFSTGPHLHYQVEVNGRLMNPLQVEFPKGDPIPEEDFSRFEQQRDALIDQL